jgi:HlyD family secretion protein
MRHPRYRKLVGLVAAGLLLTACGTAATATDPAADATATPIPPVAASDDVVADARVLPQRFAHLNFQVSGIVTEILVVEGQQVEPDTPLVRLDSRSLELQVQQAETSLAESRANYERLVSGATPEEVAAAQAAIAEAAAGVQEAQGSVTADDLAAAQARLDQARTAFAELERGPQPTEVTQARAALEQATTSLQAQRDALSGAKTNAQLALDQAANQLRDLQASYSRIYWQNRELEKLPGDLPQEARDSEESAMRAVQNGERALEQANLAYEQARQAEVSGVRAAELQVEEAQARLDQLLAGARAQVAQAEADLSSLTGDARAGQVNAAASRLDSAEARLAQLTAAPHQSDLTIAQAQVQMAEIALQRAQIDLENSTLRAPFAGTVAELNLVIGEAPDGTEGPAVVLADLSGWRIETEDLSELSVVKIHEGDPATITFDALDDFALEGTVSRISVQGQNFQGDMTYRVEITPLRWDDRLRWNMTATVTISSDR